MIYLDALWKADRFANVSGKSIGVPFGVNLDPSLVDFLSRWIHCNGISWSAEKVKLLKVWAYHILAGDHEFSMPWFKKILYKGVVIPKLNLFRYFVDHLSLIGQVKLVLIVLNSYKLRTLGEPSLSSVTETPVSDNVDNYIPLLRRYVDLPHVPQFALEGTEVVNTKSMYCDDFGITHEGPYGLYDSDFPAELALTFKAMNEEPLCVGRLTAIADKGKFRTILVGNRAVQLKTKKLADWLRWYLWNLPEVASGDQTKMVDFVLKSFKERRTLLSIDLSNATDRLSVEVQKKLLISMGVPKGYFTFLNLPFYYQAEMFGKGVGLKKGRYSNGQPMGLFVSFPMFELMHYVILKSVVSVCKADFCICGDDVVISCDALDAPNLFKRYKTLIERFGGEISKPKTMVSRLFAEGVGAIFLSDYPKEIRIPTGKLSLLEAFTPGTWVYNQVHSLTPIGRALLYPWLSTKEWKEYSYEHRRSLNDLVVNLDLDDWKTESLQSLASHDDYVTKWRIWEEDPHLPLMKRDIEVQNLRWVSVQKYRDALVSHKIVTLYKKRE